MTVGRSTNNTSRGRLRVPHWLVVTAMMALCVPATTYARSCWDQTLFYLIDPKVVFIKGDANPVNEEQRWGALEGQLLGPRDLLGPHELAVGQEMFSLERLP